MSEAAIKFISDNFNLDENAARHIVQAYLDQEQTKAEVRRFQQLRAGGTPTPAPTTPEEAKRPPARQVDPLWYITNAWQMLEPTIAWPLGIYQMAKMGLAAGSGLPVAAALPKRLGGMTARELWITARTPKVATQFQNYYNQPKASRFSFTRPTASLSGTAKSATASPFGQTGIPPRTLGVTAWAPAAGILGTIGTATAAPPGQEWCFGAYHTQKECQELARTGGAL